jgi:hypothetical protein
MRGFVDWVRISWAGRFAAGFDVVKVWGGEAGCGHAAAYRIAWLAPAALLSHAHRIY